MFSSLLYDTGIFQLGWNRLDQNKNPIPEYNGRGITFGIWGSEHRYEPIQCKVTFENYKEHEVFYAGEKGITASLTYYLMESLKNQVLVRMYLLREKSSLQPPK